MTRKNNGIKIETTKSKIGKENKKTDRTDDASKFEIYSNFQGYIDNIQSHQTMAINRAENLKVNSLFVTTDSVEKYNRDDSTLIFAEI